MGYDTVTKDKVEDGTKIQAQIVGRDNPRYSRLASFDVICRLCLKEGKRVRQEDDSDFVVYERWVGILVEFRKVRQVREK